MTFAFGAQYVNSDISHVCVANHRMLNLVHLALDSQGLRNL